jgi:aminopeptidase-like protein
VVSLLERNRCYVNQNPKCEPQLGKRGLYRKVGGEARNPTRELAMLWVLNLSDGRHSLLQIAERSGIDFDTIAAAAEQLSGAGLLRCPVDRDAGRDELALPTLAAPIGSLV